MRGSGEEDKFQENCATWIRLQYPKLLFHHSPNGGKRDAREAAKFKRMGTRAGCPDLMFYKRNKTHIGLAIELKRGKNSTSESQEDFMDELTKEGWLCVTVWTVDVFMKIVNDYLKDL